MKFRTTTLALLATIATAAFGSAPINADHLTREQLVNSLIGVKTRVFDPERAARQEKFRSFVNTLKRKKTRQITLQERTEVAKFVKENELPTVDLEVYFEYNSAEVTSTAKPKLVTLGRALKDDRLKGKIFLIAGHTDARGSNAYNQALSERRAESVKQFLVGSLGVDESSLMAIGYGEEQLKNPGTPEADENRRVQVVTLGQ